MRKVNKQTARSLDLIRERMNGGGYARIDNSGGVFMAVVMERIGTVESGPVRGELISLAHYGKQNGDLMRDPDVVFLRSTDGDWYPDTFRNDYLGVLREAIVWDESGGVKGFYKRRQNDLAIFCAGWLRNIVDQQSLKKENLHPAPTSPEVFSATTCEVTQ